MTEYLSEEFPTKEEADAFAYGLTYGDEKHWLLGEIYHVVASGAWIVTFEYPE